MKRIDPLFAPFPRKEASFIRCASPPDRVVAFWPSVGKWLPGGALNGVLQLEAPSGAAYLPVAAAAALLLAYAAAFAGVSGGFSASFVPSAIDPLLQGLSQAGARILDPAIELNPLNNYYFTTASSLLIIGVGWLVTSKVIEPRHMVATQLKILTPVGTAIRIVAYMK